MQIRKVDCENPLLFTIRLNVSF